MNQSLVLLGRQPALGLTELESLYGTDNLRAISPTAALLDVPVAEVAFNRLGGAIKLASVLATIDKTDWREVESYLLKFLPGEAQQLPNGKLTIGLSAIGFKISTGQLNALGLSLKKAIRKSQTRPVRLVPNKELELSSAQVFHNDLTADRSWELLIVRDDQRTIIARTTAVQDIDSYTKRDRERPKRDSRVGMLPPKLAQILINLATNSSRESAIPNSEITVLDPFCGTGVLLQEALLMGYSVYGTDLEPRMIDYSGENLDWLSQQYPLDGQTMRLEQGDATSHTWDPLPTFVAGETYLGKPFTTKPNLAILSQTVSECNLIISKFLKNIHTQLPPGSRLCLALPAWQIQPNKFKQLPLIDQMSDLGYNRIRFEHVRNDQLLYYREDQIVARQLLVLTRQ